MNNISGKEKEMLRIIAMILIIIAIAISISNNLFADIEVAWECYGRGSEGPAYYGPVINNVCRCGIEWDDGDNEFEAYCYTPGGQK